MFGRMGAAALALSLVPALGGCNGDDPEPKISDSPSVTESSPSPTASTSGTPEQETPQAFIRRWNQASTDMQNTGDPEKYQLLVSADCTPCTKLVRLVQKYYAAGGYIKAHPWQFESFEKRSGSSGSRVEFEVAFNAEATEYQPTADSPVEETSGGHTVVAVTLRRDGISWLVDYYVVVPS